MISLFIDTSTNKLIVGLYKDKKQIFLVNEDANNDLSSRVLPNIKMALDNLNLTVNDIDEIYVVNGPGSFTGIRVGVTIAKTLACSIEKPVYAVSELQLIASSSSKQVIIPMIDARRGYVYAGIYNKNLKNIDEDKYILLEELKKKVKKEYKKEEVEYVSYNKIEGSVLPTVNIERLLSKGKFKSTEAHLLNPNYLKKTEAEEKLNDKKN